MNPRIVGFPASSAWPRAAAGATLVASACLIVAGCAGSGASSSFGAAAHGPAGAGAPAGSAAGGRAISAPRAAVPGGGNAGLPRLAATGQAIVYTASVTLRSTDVSRAAAQAGRLATAAGGYVASENTSISPRHPGRSTVLIELKLPVSAYPATLTALTSGRLGTQVSLSRSARNVTQAVADVSSRVASARAAIAQLRSLLARAGSVSALLEVQNEINSEESSLESLLAQQRTLNSQTAYATVSVLLEGRTAAAPHRKPAGGFAAGLAAGWRAFTRVGAAALTGLGAALPFLLVIAVLASGGYGAWRWRLGRRTRPGTTG